MVAHGIYTRQTDRASCAGLSAHEVVKHSRWCPSGLSLSTVFLYTPRRKNLFTGKEREKGEEKEERGGREGREKGGGKGRGTERGRERG